MDRVINIIKEKKKCCFPRESKAMLKKIFFYVSLIFIHSFIIKSIFYVHGMELDSTERIYNQFCKRKDLWEGIKKKKKVFFSQIHLHDKHFQWRILIALQNKRECTMERKRENNPHPQGIYISKLDLAGCKEPNQLLGNDTIESQS